MPLAIFFRYQPKWCHSCLHIPASLMLGVLNFHLTSTTVPITNSQTTRQFKRPLIRIQIWKQPHPLRRTKTHFISSKNSVPFVFESACSTKQSCRFCKILWKYAILFWTHLDMKLICVPDSIRASSHEAGWGISILLILSLFLSIQGEFSRFNR